MKIDRMEDAERLVRLHSALINDVCQFRDNSGGVNYNFSDSNKAINAVAQAISKALSDTTQ